MSSLARSSAATAPIVFADFALDHVEGARRLSAAAGWPHRAEDWALAHSLSRGVVALAAGEVVATGFATPFGPIATANMIIVSADHRSRGLGREVMKRVMAKAVPEEWRLVATPEGLPLYEKLGFVPVGRIRQCQGLARPRRESAGARWAKPGELPTILALDRAATGAQRDRLIETLATAGRFAVIDAAGPARAFAGLRAFGRGALIGPLVAPDLAAAETLVAFLLAQCAGRFVRIDIGADDGLGEILASQGLAAVDEAIAMRRGRAPPAQAPLTLFALAAQAFG